MSGQSPLPVIPPKVNKLSPCPADLFTMSPERSALKPAHDNGHLNLNNNSNEADNEPLMAPVGKNGVAGDDCGPGDDSENSRDGG